MSTTREIELQHFLSWTPEGGPESLEDVCLLHDQPLEVREEIFPTPSTAHDSVFVWCMMRCPMCARDVGSYDEVLLGMCGGRGPAERFQEAIVAYQHAVHVRVRLMYYRHIRNGWRLYDIDA